MHLLIRIRDQNVWLKQVKFARRSFPTLELFRKDSLAKAAYDCRMGWFRGLILLIWRFAGGQHLNRIPDATFPLPTVKADAEVEGGFPELGQTWLWVESEDVPGEDQAYLG